MSSTIDLVDNRTLRRHSIALSTNQEDPPLTYIYTSDDGTISVSDSNQADDVKHIARISNYNWTLRLEALSDDITLAPATVYGTPAHRQESQNYHCHPLRRWSSACMETVHLRIGDRINLGGSGCSVTIARGEVEQVLGEEDAVPADDEETLFVVQPRPSQLVPKQTQQELGPEQHCEVQVIDKTSDLSLFCTQDSQDNTSQLAQSLAQTSRQTASPDHVADRSPHIAKEGHQLPLVANGLTMSNKVQHDSDADDTESDHGCEVKSPQAQTPSDRGNDKPQAAPSSNDFVEEPASKDIPPKGNNKRSTSGQGQSTPETCLSNAKRRKTESDIPSGHDTVIVTPRITRSAEARTYSKLPTPCPSSSAQSTRSSARFKASVSPVPSTAQYGGRPPRMLFSNSSIPENVKAMKFLTAHGATPVDDIKNSESNFLCVGIGELKKTGKLLLSIAKGHEIVTDQWVFDSMKAGQLLEPAPYLPSDTAREKEWGFKLAEAVKRDCTRLFQGRRICFTPALKDEYGKGFEELSYILSQSGAKELISKPAQEVRGASQRNVILLAREQADADAVTMHDAGWTCYRKDLVSLSILRGRLDLESNEFKFIPTAIEKEKAKKAGKTI